MNFYSTHIFLFHFYQKKPESTIQLFNFLYNLFSPHLPIYTSLIPIPHNLNLFHTLIAMGFLINYSKLTLVSFHFWFICCLLFHSKVSFISNLLVSQSKNPNQIMVSFRARLFLWVYNYVSYTSKPLTFYS